MSGAPGARRGAGGGTAGLVAVADGAEITVSGPAATGKGLGSARCAATYALGMVAATARATTVAGMAARPGSAGARWDPR